MNAENNYLHIYRVCSMCIAYINIFISLFFLLKTAVHLYYKVTDCIYLNRINFSTSWCTMANSSVAKCKRDKHVRSGEKR
jgi:hypothetical protein